MTEFTKLSLIGLCAAVFLVEIAVILLVFDYADSRADIDRLLELHAQEVER